ncbi:MAG: hypothetical protein II218_07660 [Peptococcaceae bacterium]|jgi:hypothetical protein|nr:hypothetical protein [Peptococcaceae bacterium]MBQ2035770.1 hypothetical protein [Peptococcaceae bacterium]MBQ5681893.1 hypothetical protein [Peptococcaceae bacterium]MBQ5702615.1 hypothetical protein [Peptococcaceae bacterium]
MDFESVLAMLGDNYKGVELFTVENRDMTDHETTIVYYQNKEDAIRDAEALWETFNEDDREYREISVHRGEIEYKEQSGSYRFLVLQKLYKAHKKVYVCEEFSKAFKEKQKAQHLADGMSEKDALAQSKKDFSAKYATQPVIKFGMFAGYDYAPKQV